MQVTREKDEEGAIIDTGPVGGARTWILRKLQDRAVPGHLSSLLSVNLRSILDFLVHLVGVEIWQFKQYFPDDLSRLLADANDS